MDKGKHVEVPQRRGREILLLAAMTIAVCIAVAFVHWPALKAQALFFDDDMYLTDNRLVQNPSLGSAWRFLSEILRPSSVHGYYQPLTMISLMFDCALGGSDENLTPFHLTSLALHVCNSAMMVILLYTLFGDVMIAAAVGLIFGVHPMTVEAIPWVGERKTLLAAFFSLWCLIIYVKYTKDRHQTSDHRPKTEDDLKSEVSSLRSQVSYVVCLAAYVLALLAKPISMPLAVLLLLLDYWPLKRIRQLSLNRGNIRCLTEKIPFFIIAAFSAYITITSQANTAEVHVPKEHGPWQFPLMVCHNILFYPLKMLWPVNLSSYYIFPEPFDLSNGMVLSGVITTVLLIPALFISLRRTRAVFAGWLFFFTAIFPTLGAIGFTIVIASDKYAYLPSAGFLMMLTSFLVWLCGKGHTVYKKAAVLIIAVFLASGETALTREQLSHWSSTVDHYQRLLDITPNQVRMLYNQANAYENLSSVQAAKGDAKQSQAFLDKAAEGYQKIIELKNADIECRYKALSNLGVAMSKKGRLKDAVNYYRESIKINPDFVTGYCNLGSALCELSRYDESLSYLEKGLSLAPDSIELRFNRAETLQAMGRPGEAETDYKKILQKDPNHSKALIKLGNLYSDQKQPQKAIELLKQAVKADPSSAAACSNLGWELKNTGRPEDAAEYFQQAMKLDPKLVPPVIGMAQVLLDHPDPAARNPKEAVVLAERAAKLTEYREAAVLDVLSRAYDAAGRTDDARTTAQRIAQLNTGSSNEYLITRYRQLLKDEPDNIDALNGLGIALGQQGRFDEAIRYFRLAIEIKSDFADAHSNLGVALVRSGNIDDGIKHLKEALRINPELDNAKRNLEVMLSSQKRTE